LWQALASPYTAELCAGAGFGWLLIDGEHAPNDLPLILAQLQAIAAYDVEPVVRLPVADTVLVKQHLDIGPRTLLLPMVRATRYPPHGVRGVGSAIGRASRWNRTPRYLAEAANEICLLLQVESVSGLQNIEAIASTEGVDGVFIGPSDLAAALGHLGDPAHGEVQPAIEQAIGRVRAAGKAAGILMADEAFARRYLDLGASFVTVGTTSPSSHGAQTRWRANSPSAAMQHPSRHRKSIEQAARSRPRRRRRRRGLTGIIVLQAGKRGTPG
jgi:4-hydroxy-2-oxoheptanedioate aldolase